MPIRLYIDEDAMSRSVIARLRARDIDVTSVIEEGKMHAGIIIILQQRYGIGEQIRKLLRLIAAKSAEDMQNNIEFLSSW